MSLPGGRLPAADLLAPTPIGPESSGAWCLSHPQRESIGLCVRCRRGICAECSTRVAGINYCPRCLAALRAAAPHATGGRQAAWPAAVHLGLAALALALLVLLSWLLLEALT